jgi:hypothetical protein
LIPIIWDTASSGWHMQNQTIHRRSSMIEPMIDYRH